MTVIDPITINNFEQHDTDTKCALLYVAVQELSDTIKEIKQYLDWDEISGESAENCKCAKNAQSDVKENFTTEHIADTSKKIKRAADSANKNLDNALDVAVDALKRIADAPIGYNLYAEEALEKISEILKITKGGDNEYF